MRINGIVLPVRCVAAFGCRPMACYHPLTGYWATSTDGGRSIVFDFNKSNRTGVKVILPCGQCVGCRLERSRQWAVRCMHEASLHKDNCFVTLTYNDFYLPENGSLVKSDFQKFMKRLRKRVGTSVRYYYCGEYGENFGRPHYHAVLFGYDFKDKFLWRENTNGDRCYRSKLLEELWPFGLSEIGDVTFQSAAYVARYVMKKRTGKQADEYYGSRLPEYNDMSRRPGVGALWLEKYQNDVYPHDFMVMNGKKMRPPRFYDNRYEINYPAEIERIKELRTKNMRRYRSNNTEERLLVREFIARNRVSKLVRRLK